MTEPQHREGDMTVPETAPLFDEPQHVELPQVELYPSEAYAQEAVDTSTLRDGLRHLWLGEDSEWLVFLGHPRVEQVLDVARAIAREEWDYTDDEMPTVDDLEFEHARLMTTCPKHDTTQDGCPLCNAVAESWVMDWSTEDGESNAGKEGYFPIVVWRTES